MTGTRRINSLSKLWQKHIDDLKAQKALNDGRVERHLVALALDSSTIVREPTLLLSKSEWQQRVGFGMWYDEVVEQLVQLELVRNHGSKYRLAIPVLCIPMNSEETWSQTVPVSNSSQKV